MLFDRQNAKSWPQPPLLEGFTATAWQRIVALQAWRLFILVLGGYVVLSRSFPPKPEKPAGRYHVSPKSAKRSINFCKIPVKGKTLNIVDAFVPRLFVVVMFHAYIRTFCGLFIQPAQYTKASKRW